MGRKLLMRGNEAIAEAAIRAGCLYYFGYPITPQTEIAHYMARKLPKAGGVFLQAESEVAAINMVYGAGSTGARVMTSSSSPGISLKQEGLSYLAGAQVPAVVVNIMRAGPGLGGIQPSQSDYFQACKGGGHGDYRQIVLAPSSVQELYELTVEAFNLADKYRIVVMILGDGILGQMMEVVEFRDEEPVEHYEKPWAVTGHGNNRKQNIITSIHLDPAVLEKMNRELQKKYELIKQKECRYELYRHEEAELFIVAYGTVARIAKSVIEIARREGIKVGLIRPITLWPFPAEAFDKVMDMAKAFLTVEMSSGQMIEDVLLAVNGRRRVYFHGRMGGMVPVRDDILEIIRRMYDEHVRKG
ncbi:ketoisovalerate oxidoreductase subunit VorB [Thermoclostridium stercorarium subsp. stercorarium DSM 8532]|uniref:Ketoisovalerate oxidoreductase subunit VorB n=1 Tax=Thermoclostridium stercorarium (strain ATCC 35414 / DSM 8532 / NCIMB 11754) TaxID=1121335 RepID=L7VJI1_THES1|nr:3-methyl-2-oxobutanoate dehydrogenase subunit VorB [Thermoclostridium stercorarium]AGC68240.1 ketoisovalerate oxidoreductase subunit VorB [Thermoclostridium stercorarium subsp. stercorarium DSM 8532]AGI39267.1 pyruvate-ferredoxin oxidoreductase alpha subunit [Thermoclostridium stercorarium subsp. stercorarium DSM 8532]